MNEAVASEVEVDVGPTVGAFFDVDHTLLECNTGRKYVEYLWRNDAISLAALLRSAWWLVQYRMSILDYEQVTSDVLSGYAGRDVEELVEELEGWFRSDIESEICTEGLERVAWHRGRGHTLVLLTSGTALSVEPLRELLDIPHLVCTRLEINEGKLTGRHVPPSCFGPGKLEAGMNFAQAHAIDLGRSYFYTDSYSDRPMLERVGNPRVINPDPRLKRWAEQQDMSVEMWHAQGFGATRAAAEAGRAEFGQGARS